MQINRLPSEIVDLAHRLGAQDVASPSIVLLKQSGTMRSAASESFTRFWAKQQISVRALEFEWRARTGPAGAITIVDALKYSRATLSVRALGLIPIARVPNSPALAKGEIMRYLAELAWAPDAIICNRELDWTLIDGQIFAVAAGEGLARGTVEFKLNTDGRIGSVTAPDRPHTEGTKIVERQWQGRFFDYRQHSGRWLPFQGEVGWTLDSNPFVAWRGQLTKWGVK